jgi:methanogen homocitrate synthase
MAVATELAGIMAGAEVVHSCINGLGERTGNAALEELMLGIHVLLGIRKNNYKFNELIKIAGLIEEITGIKLPQNKPITGKRNFTRESGIGVDLVIKKPLAMFATDPKFTGRKGEIVLGKKSGKLSILYNLERIGIKNIGEQKLVEILKMVKLLGINKRELVTLNEFKEITKKVLG